MVTEVIFASKVFRTSRRKEAVTSALMLPNNQGLVQQLADALDEEYKYAAEPQNQPNEGAEGEFDSLDPRLGDDFDVEGNLVHVSDGGGGGPLGPKPTGDGSIDLGDEEMPEGEVPEDADLPEEPAEDEPPADEPVEESTKISACQDIDTSLIKGSLNSVAGTAGVTRIVTKEKELWIYYNDDVNMNDIMIDVVDYLNASGQTNLEFNRLARSDNAMVFIINEQKEEIKPVENTEEDK